MFLCSCPKWLQNPDLFLFYFFYFAFLSPSEIYFKRTLKFPQSLFFLRLMTIFPEYWEKNIILLREDDTFRELKWSFMSAVSSPLVLAFSGVKYNLIHWIEKLLFTFTFSPCRLFEISDWLSNNFLHLNAVKTKVLIVAMPWLFWNLLRWTLLTQGCLFLHMYNDKTEFDKWK